MSYSLRADINREKKHIDDIQTKRAHTHDNNELILNQLRNELALYGVNPSWEKSQLKTKIQATAASCTAAFARFRQNEQEHMDELADLEANFIPIQLLSTQSNQKNLTIPKKNSSLGWIPHQDKYVPIQNTRTPPESGTCPLSLKQSSQIFHLVSMGSWSSLTKLVRLINYY